MRKAELRKLVSEYRELVRIYEKTGDARTLGKIGRLEHRYYHETGRNIDSDKSL